MPEPARVRVFLRSYNRRDQLERAVESILAQTFETFDLVIIDDASSDGAAELAQGYARRLPEQVTAVVKPVNRGPLDSLDLAFTMVADSEFAAFVDDDDLWHPDKLARQVAEFDREPNLGLVATEALVVDEAGAPTGERFSDLFRRPRGDDLATEIFDANFLCASSVLVRTSTLPLLRDRYTGFRGACFDMYMWIVISAHAGSRWLSDPLTYYGRSGTGLTAERPDEMWRETHALRRHAFDRFPAVREKVGEHLGERRINGDALFRAMLNLRQRRLRDYWWFSRQVLSQTSPRWTAIWLWLSIRNLPLVSPMSRNRATEPRSIGS